MLSAVEGKARHALGEFEPGKAPPDAAVQQPVVDRPSEPAANAGEVRHIGAERRRTGQAWVDDVIVSVDERRGIAFDAEQELAALPIVAELAADDGAIEVDARQVGRGKGPAHVLPRIAAVEAD